jgi:putative heme-binding domain-containing protein
LTDCRVIARRHQRFKPNTEHRITEHLASNTERAIMNYSWILAVPLLAAPVADLRVPPGFVVEEYAGDDLAHDCYTLALDERGRVTVAGRGYIHNLREANGVGVAAEPVRPWPKDGAMGLHWENGTLWAVGDGGLWRLHANGHDERVWTCRTGGEHAAHAVRRGPDGWLYVLCGNHTGVTGQFNRGTAAPPIAEPTAGCVVRFSPDLTRREIVAHGLRNAYGFDFNPAGHWFTYDSDNERCLGLPWYEPTRFYHLRPGGHYGWLAPQRGDAFRLPPYHPQVIAPLATLERGSPTGVVCYKHTTFTARYQGGVFVADWTFGRIWFLPLKPHGETYQTQPEVFLHATGSLGFAPTGLAVHPLTGDLFISIGGRGTRGGVYRVRATAAAQNVPVVFPPVPAVPNLDAVFAVQTDAGGIDAKRYAGTMWEGYTPGTPRRPLATVRADLAKLWPAFPSGQPNRDRELARTAALVTSPEADVLAALLAQVTPQSPAVDDVHYLTCAAQVTAARTPAQTTAVAAHLLTLDRKYATQKQPRDRHWPLRVGELVRRLAERDPRLPTALLDHAEFGRPEHVLFARWPGALRTQAAERFAAQVTQADYEWSAEVVALLHALPAARMAELVRPQWEQQGLRDAIVTGLARQPVLADRAKLVAGLRSVQPAVVQTCLAALEQLAVPDTADEVAVIVRAWRRLPRGTEGDRLRPGLTALLERCAGAKLTDPVAWFRTRFPQQAGLVANADGVDVAAWSKRLAGIDWGKGDPERGARVFKSAACAGCHNGARAIGPDLTGVTSRFARADLFTAILQPSLEVPARYRAVTVATHAGKVFTGLVIYEAVDGILLQTGPEGVVRVNGPDLAERSVSERSLMPAGLLDPLSDGQIADLEAYLRSLTAPNGPAPPTGR